MKNTTHKWQDVKNVVMRYFFIGEHFDEKRKEGESMQGYNYDDMTCDEIFQKYLPETLYMSHYLLADNYGHSAQEWRKYLRDNNTFIETELAAIAEAEARGALARLSNASGAEVQALKAILEKSKLINDSQKQAVKVILTHIPKTETKEEYHARHHSASPGEEISPLDDRSFQ